MRGQVLENAMTMTARRHFGEDGGGSGSIHAVPPLQTFQHLPHRSGNPTLTVTPLRSLPLLIGGIL
ncbi:MAG: hypothetical protein GWO24_28825 [Akkermansiaceae bacterium]|nr:hypothetical protein [Akkermansiaceae bacterium]